METNSDVPLTQVGVQTTDSDERHWFIWCSVMISYQLIVKSNQAITLVLVLVLLWFEIG